MAGLGSELARKAVHVAMGGFAFALRWLAPWQAAVCAALAIVFNRFFLHRVTRGGILRDGESASSFASGTSLYPVAVLGLVLVFHDRLELAAGAWALLAFGDGMATIAGKVVGGPKLPWNRSKSWAGLLGFVTWGTATAALVIPWVQRAALDGSAAAASVGTSFLDSGVGRVDPVFLIAGCAVAAVAAALAESVDSGIDDNVVVPVIGGAVLYAATFVRPERLAAFPEGLAGEPLTGFGVNVVLAVAAYAVRGVTVAGAVTGTVLGTALYAFGGPAVFAMLFAFFVLGTVTTKLGFRKKASLGIAQERGGRRGPRNAFANVSGGLIFAGLGFATGRAELFVLAATAAFATAAADTVSSEIGQAYGRRHVLVTNFKRVPAGTDGAVSIEGTLAGLAAAGALGVLGWALGAFGPTGAATVAFAGFVGNTLESYLGAAVDGIREVDNELVNFANTVAGGAVAIVLVAF